jgi:ABC-type spermidine/putrescine transport system permease subunit I
MATVGESSDERGYGINEAVSHYIESYADSSYGQLVLLLPAALVLLLLLLLPTALILRMSFNVFRDGSVVASEFTLSNYTQVLSDAYYRSVVVRTLKVAVVVTVVDFLLGFPLAYAAVRGGRLLGGAIVVATLAPLSIDLVVRTYGWYVLLGEGGLVPNVLVAVGPWTAENPPTLLFNEVGIVVGLIHVLLPFMVFPIMNVMHTIPYSYEEAAQNLGANRFVVFYRILLPLALPGIAAGTLIVFTNSVAAYVTPAILGGGVKTLAVVITETFQSSSNWPLGSTLAIVLVVLALVVIGLYQRVLTQLEGALGRGS